MFINAKFTGKNSLGYENGKSYDLHVSDVKGNPLKEQMEQENVLISL